MCWSRREQGQKQGLEIEMVGEVTGREEVTKKSWKGAKSQEANYAPFPQSRPQGRGGRPRLVGQHLGAELGGWAEQLTF